MIGRVGTGTAFALNAATFLLSAAFLVRIVIPPHAGQLTAGATRGLGGCLADARDGLVYALGDRLVSRLLIVQSLAALATGATSAMLVVLTERHLRLSPCGFAWRSCPMSSGASGTSCWPSSRRSQLRSSSWSATASTRRRASSSTARRSGGNAGRGPGRVFTLLDVSWNAMRLRSLALAGVLGETVSNSEASSSTARIRVASASNANRGSGRSGNQRRTSPRLSLLWHITAVTNDHA